MIVKILGNLSDGHKEYSNGFHYDETDDFIRRNSQNVLPFNKMTPEQKVMAQKANKVKAFVVNTSFQDVKKNKMMGPVETKGTKKK